MPPAWACGQATAGQSYARPDSIWPLCALPGNAARDDTGPGRDAHPRPHHNLPLRSELDIHPRAELDHPDPLTGCDRIAYLLAEHDAPRDQSRDLLESHA